VLLDATSGKQLAGHAAIRENFAGLIAAKGKVECKVVKVVRSGDVALVDNDWTGTVLGPDGKRVEIGGGAMEVVRRQPDGARGATSWTIPMCGASPVPCRSPARWTTAADAVSPGQIP
jgi:ketosteroid isomerase-like protein